MAPLHRRKRYVQSSELAILSAIATLSLLAICSFGARQRQGEGIIDQLLVGRTSEEKDIECRLVHNVRSVADQCVFIKTNCADEEAGLISYLQLYYCSLAHVKPVAFIVIVLWSSLLFSTIGVAASDFLCVNLSTIAAVLGMSESLTGVTFLAFGNGSPDVFATFAAMKSNSSSLAVGELVGAAGFITTVVAGSMAITSPFSVGRKSFVRDVGFFAVAAGFSMVFLSDGSLQLWECIAMVAFYIFYVLFVVAWHWHLQRQRRQKLAELAARLHHHIPDQQELEVPQIQVDEDSRPAGERDPLVRSTSRNSIPSLPTPANPAWVGDGDDEDDEARDRALAELQSNMRVNRRRERRSTINPIRPSLLGAIEFRSVLNALEKRATSNQAIGLRRYSDDGWQDTAPNRPFSISQPHLAVTAPEESPISVSTERNRAVATKDTARLRIDTDLMSPAGGTQDTATHNAGQQPSPFSNRRRTQSDVNSRDHLAPSYTQTLALSPGSISTSSGTPSPNISYTDQRGMLAPPSPADYHFHRPDYAAPRRVRVTSPVLSPNMDVPVLRLPDPEHRKSPRPQLFPPPGTTLPSSRPPSIWLPSPIMAQEPGHAGPLLGDEQYLREMPRFRWWPYKSLELPHVILCTLFPGLTGWRNKTVLGKLAALFTAPSIFLLAITLPVVDSGGDEDIEESIDPGNTTVAPSNLQTYASLQPDTPAALAVDSRTNSAGQHPHSAAPSTGTLDTPKSLDYDDPAALSNQRGWNRWLVIVQLFTAPLFVVLIVWANLDEHHTVKELLLPAVGCLILSSVGLLALLATTTSEKEPRFRPALCFLGFAVAIAWISTIANEVVGVLKAIGVILDMSDAILGLTIFAVGNSLGDLVADITIAKMGFPKMALSACFGGPMLNILLGIGLGGMYMTIHNSRRSHRKHPDRPIKFKPYELEVSTTLMVSGIALLVTLTGLLIFVPLNRWRMDRKIGLGLIALWTIATTGNVIVEVLGLGTEGAVSV